MRRFVAFALTLLIASAAMAHGQEPQGRKQKNSGLRANYNRVLLGMFFLKRADVRSDLKMSPAAIASYKAMESKVFRESVGATQIAESQAAVKKVAALLSAVQKKRLSQIFYQAQSGFSLSYRNVQDKLGLSAAQRDKVHRIRQEGVKRFQAEMKKEGKQYKPNPETTRWIIQSIFGVMTPEQKKKWDAFIGPPHKFNPPLPGR